MLSVPVWCLDDSRFKRLFKNPTNTFIVHYVLLSDVALCQHHVAIFGTDNAVLQFNEEQLTGFMALWTAHGKKMVPTYRTASAVDPHNVIVVDAGEVPRRKRRKSQSGASPRPSKSLYDRFPMLVHNWGIHPSLRLQQTGTRCPEALVRVVDKLLETRAPWGWKNNSCHLDSWLMVELALYDTLARRGSFTDALLLSAPRLQRLFQVLLAVGSNDQDHIRNAYWVMEIEDWRGPSLRSSFEKASDHDIHRQVLYAPVRDEELHLLTTMTISCSVSCSSGGHAEVDVDKPLRTIQCIRAWYSMPDSSFPSRCSNDGSWTMPQVREHVHTGPADLLATVAARSDSKLTKCKCGNGYAVANKKVLGTRMPLFLAFRVYKSKMPIPLTFTFGGLEYRLVGVVFGGSGHFNCNVCLAGTWYHYDDLGFREPHLYGDHAPGIRLVRTKLGGHLSPGRIGFEPITARYVRTDNRTLLPMPLDAPGSVPQDKQFEEFDMLWEHDADPGRTPPDGPPVKSPAVQPLVDVGPRPAVQAVQRTRQRLLPTKASPSPGTAHTPRARRPLKTPYRSPHATTEDMADVKLEAGDKVQYYAPNSETTFENLRHTTVTEVLGYAEAVERQNPVVFADGGHKTMDWKHDVTGLLVSVHGKCKQTSLRKLNFVTGATRAPAANSQPAPLAGMFQKIRRQAKRDSGQFAALIQEEVGEKKRKNKKKP